MYMNNNQGQNHQNRGWMRPGNSGGSGGGGGGGGNNMNRGGRPRGPGRNGPTQVSRNG
jgi:hypothetical protein